MMEEITYASVWKTLSAFDVNKWKKQIEQAGRKPLDYLSWSGAWLILMQKYPMATYEFLPEEHLPNGSVMVFCTVTIGPVVRTMHLPVMDYKNNSIVNPTSRQISDCRMRCLVKCIAMLGLGFYIYEGQQLPYQEEELPDKEVDKAEAESQYQFIFEKKDGTIVGSNDGKEFFKVVGSELSNPKNVAHQNLFAANEKMIRGCRLSLDEDDPVRPRFDNLIAAYEKAKGSEDADA